jgi:hypothetical protein
MIKLIFTRHTPFQLWNGVSMMTNKNDFFFFKTDQSINQRTMSNISALWMVKDDILYTTNNGYDSDKKPYIPFSEFLQDVIAVVSITDFIQMTNDMFRNEISKLPAEMKMMALTIIKYFRENYETIKAMKGQDLHIKTPIIKKKR